MEGLARNADPVAGAANSNAVGLASVTKRFPGVVAVDDVSLSFRAGEVHVLLGENGAGKSTIVGMLAGVLQPDSGGLTLAGEPVQLSSPFESLSFGISTVFQHAMLVPTLTVFENLVLGDAWWRRSSRSQMEERIAELQELFGLQVPLDAMTGELSLGEQQQIEIARALLRDCSVLILDEATSMLTPQGVDELGGRMRRLADRGLSIIFITHKLTEAYRFGDRVSVLKLGRLAGEIGKDSLKAASEASAVEDMLRLMFGGEESAATPAPQPDRTAGEVRLAAANLRIDGGSVNMAHSEISLAVRSGEILGIAGIDGNGQKQLAEALAGQRPILAGRLDLDGEDVTDASVGRRRALGLRYLTDDRLDEGSVGMFPVADNTVLKEIGAPPFWSRGIERPARIAEHARDLIKRFAVRTPNEFTPISNLSGGNIQKLLLGRELSGTAKVVVFNKPTYGLDMQNSVDSRRRIRAVANSGIAVLLISTDLDEIIELSDRIAVMDRGRICGVLENNSSAPREMRTRVGRLMVGDAAMEAAA
ncbi:MAG: ABC transporter ATP-binding protein [Albidovulum sp.]|nr:ABC transporter ATP-binding protein [Albidovulum sp.]MDE0304780.1 ABC transporter ATP-binding protein [Albidovulum sp.]MDE0534565.1 ABC transporter ATP-binding protein [Albidovulum sp.]